MAHHKKRRRKNRCAGCKMCKPWKIDGINKDSPAAQKFGDYKRRFFANQELRAY
jgi:hypothetical protein